MKVIIAAVILSTLVLVGCSTVQKVVDDYRIGAETSLAEGEISPREAAEAISGVVGSVFPPAVVPLAVVLTLFGTWRRGRRIRKNIPASSNPITGHFGEKIGLESLIQNIANISQGIFTVGENGTVLKRGWKIAVAGGIGLLLFNNIPQVQQFVQSNSELSNIVLVALASVVAGLEKGLGKVLPLKGK